MRAVRRRFAVIRTFVPTLVVAALIAGAAFAYFSPGQPAGNSVLADGAPPRVAASLVAASLPVAAPEAGYDARAPWLPAERQADAPTARFESELATLPATSPSLLFVGDSITENWLTYGRAIWNSDYAGRGAANLGFGGDRTENTLWRIDRGELDGIAPRVTILEIGTNDLGRWRTSEIALGIKTVVAKIRAKLPATRIVILAILPRDRTPAGPYRKAARAVNDLLSEIAFGPGTRYADIGESLLAPDGTLLPGVMADGVLHPSPQGYERLAPEIDRLIASP